MTLTIELNAEVEAELSFLARAWGLALPEIAREALENQLPKAPSPGSAKQWADAWRASSEGLPLGPPLSDEAISRATLYAPRG